MAKANAKDLATYGHIAARLREYLAKEGISAGDLSVKLGLERGSATPYKWLTGTGGPGKALRTKLSKLTGLSETELSPRRRNTPSSTVTMVMAPKPSHPKNESALSFKTNGDGTARIQFDVTLPLDTAMSLLRVLMEAGVGKPTD